jgi:nucleotidyltransferase substrate binding protein (TIGR01987 family)
MDKEVRYKQRFEHYKSALSLLEDTLEIEINRITRGALIKHYEMTIELAWKLLKDYLESQGLLPRTPREVIKHAFQSQIIDDGKLWLDALDERNETVHTYNEDQAIAIADKIINIYMPLFKKLRNDFEEDKL